MKVEVVAETTVATTDTVAEAWKKVDKLTGAAGITYTVRVDGREVPRPHLAGTGDEWYHPLEDGLDG